MQFSTAISEVAAQLGLDQTQTDTKTLIKRWLNLAYTNDIAAAWNWSWLESRESVTMATDYTTGTVSATAASATITFSASITASQTGRYIQFSSADDWYKISAHTAGTDTATIDPVYAQSSNLTSGTFTIRTFFYKLSTSAEHIYNVKEATNPSYLPIISADKYDSYAPFPDDTGTPERIIVWGRDSNRQIQFTPFPWPDAALLLEFRTYNRATDLSADTDTPLFPAKLDSLWIDGAITYGYRFLDDSRERAARRDFLGKIELHKQHDEPPVSQGRVLKSVDQGIDSRFIVDFPSTYGRTY